MKNAAPFLDPQHVSLDLTYRCDQSCPFCFMARSAVREPGRKKELSLAAWKKFIDTLSSRPREFYIAGGEPGLRKDLPEIVAHIKKGGHRCLITTNGSSLDLAAAGKLLKAGLDEIAVSLHGPPGLHDRIAGLEGAFRKAAAVCAFINSSPFKDTRKLTIYCAVNAANHDKLYQAYKVFKAMKPDYIAFNHLDFIMEGARLRTEALFKKELGSPLRLQTSQAMAEGVSVKKLAAEIRKIKAAKDPSCRFELDLSETELEAWYDHGREFKKKGFCLGQWNGVWVGPNGDLVSCLPLGHVMGNILKGDWRAVFNGPAYNRFRELLVKQGGFLPTCSRCGRSSYHSLTQARQAETAHLRYSERRTK